MRVVFMLFKSQSMLQSTKGTVHVRDIDSTVAGIAQHIQFPEANKSLLRPKARTNTRLSRCRIGS